VTARGSSRSSAVRPVGTDRRPAICRGPLEASFRLPPSALLCATFALGLASCAGDGEERVETSSNAADQGTIILYQPTARGSRTGRRLQASTIRITTESEAKSGRDEPTRMDDNTENPDVVVREGRIVGEGPTGKGTAQEIMRQFQASATVVSRETFAALWTEFEKAGVFALPRFKGGIPPKDQPTLTITSGGRTWTFLRPTDDKDPAKFKKMWEAWSRAKALVTATVVGG
jgi:hypothetical protein